VTKVALFNFRKDYFWTIWPALLPKISYWKIENILLEWSWKFKAG